jgi:hypothetical protein
MIQIELTQGKQSLVDDCDSDLDELNWRAYKDRNTFYAVRDIKKPDGKWTSQKMHRVILERKLGRPLVKGELCDHINGNGLDNRRSNLRAATKAENGRNRGVQRNSKSGLKCVYFEKRRSKWRASIKVDGKRKHLGYFDTPEGASLAYQAAAKRYYGEFARAA